MQLFQFCLPAKSVKAERIVKKISFGILLGFILAGCSSNTPQLSSEAMQGTWCFAYMQKSDMFSAPPKFDVYTFSSGNKINIESSLENMNFDGTYSLSGDNLSYSFKPKDVSSPIEHKVKCSFIDYGQTLIISHKDTELVYYRPDRFYAYDIAGDWTSRSDGQPETMHLGRDGKFVMEKSGIFGHYRLWPSKFGKALSANVFIPDHGGYLMLFTYEQGGSELKLTPLSGNGPEKASSSTWKLKK